MVPIDDRPTDDEILEAKAAFIQAREVLQRAHRAEERREREAIVGKCFRFIDSGKGDSPAEWPVYLAAIQLDDEGHLTGWHFQIVPTTGSIEVSFEPDLQPGWLVQHCVEVPRDLFVTEFNELLTAVARFATIVPTS